ncbi:rhomboid family intramembrane serine protease [bacterium]|nr:rhomboid family intramembrane serine protease [bacterium]
MKFKITFNSPVVLVFMIICFVATIANYVTSGWTNQFVFSTYHSSLLNPMTYIRFFTHVFGHANFSHFWGNSLMILLLGPMLEEKYGSVMLIKIIAISALVTSLVNYILFWDIALLGASGVVFSFILLTSFTGFKDGEIPMTFILVTIVYLGREIFNAITVQDNISQMGHIIGGLVGAAAGYKLNRRIGPDYF